MYSLPSRPQAIRDGPLTPGPALKMSLSPVIADPSKRPRATVNTDCLSVPAGFRYEKYTQLVGGELRMQHDVHQPGSALWPNRRSAGNGLRVEHPIADDSEPPLPFRHQEAAVRKERQAPGVHQSSSDGDDADPHHLCGVVLDWLGRDRLRLESRRRHRRTALEREPIAAPRRGSSSTATEAARSQEEMAAGRMVGIMTRPVYVGGLQAPGRRSMVLQGNRNPGAGRPAPVQDL